MVLKQQVFIQKTSLAALLNAFKDGANFTAVGRLFQSFRAEKVKEHTTLLEISCRGSSIVRLKDYLLSDIRPLDSMTALT